MVGAKDNRTANRTAQVVALLAASLLGPLSVGMGASSAFAQTGPDVRGVRPVVMLLVDSSGSMEYLSTTPGATASCGAACLPVCNGAASTRNRWAMTVEALTGQFTSFECEAQDRTTATFGGLYDQNYYLPHNRLATERMTQLSDGILDAYRDRIKFGLMTFDGIGTIAGGDPLVPASTFLSPGFLQATEIEPGMWSYGDPRPLSFPGCATTYMINNGARNPNTIVGGLISVGSQGDDHRLVNQLVQDRLLSVRPYGGTPIAGMLDDLDYYVRTNPDIANAATVTGGDAFYDCRSRYAILLTDGYPDSDFRDGRFRCDTAGINPLTGSPYECPYDTPENLAARLCQISGGSCTGDLDGLFVIGFAVEPGNRARLDGIAALGGTQRAYFAETRDQLMQALSAALDQAATNTTTRTAPAFASGSPGGSADNTQFQFNAGFKINNAGRPWSGVLERQRFVCDTALVPQPQALSDSAGDRFHVALNQRVVEASPRRLLTVVPSNEANAGRWLTGTQLAAPVSSFFPATPVETGLAMEPFRLDNARITPSLISAPNSSRRDEVIKWVHGTADSTRNGDRMGGIYHSTPVVVGPPPQDIAEENYNLFRLRTDIAQRASMVYVGTSDGILHAFAAEDFGSVRAGEEVWGFIPPALLPKITSASVSPQVMMDGTPVVHELYLQKAPSGTANASMYRTVLVAAIRGTPGYFALDVTDPMNPQFLWQYASPNMGEGISAPAVGQAVVGTSRGPEGRALAFLQGGTGTLDSAQAFATGAAGCVSSIAPPTSLGPAGAGTYSGRPNIRCWNQRGRLLSVIDVGTGALLREFTASDISAPITGGMSLFNGNVGQSATRAFVTDADGVMWRVNFSNFAASAWTIEPFHDIFWDAAPLAGQPALFPPVISVKDGRTVIIQGTGDIDRLDGTGANRIVSLTENIIYGTGGIETSVAAEINWEQRLRAGEMVTGPIDMFDSKVYFGTFHSLEQPTNACAYGASRVWGLHFYESIPSASAAPLPEGKQAMDDGVGGFVQYIGDFANTLVMGIGVTQRPNCYEGVSVTDPYFGGSRYQVTRAGGGDFQLVAQLSGAGASAAGGEISTITRTLTRPRSGTRVLSWGSVE